MTRAPGAPWDRLRAWIDQQEAWEKQHGRAVELTSKEMAAIYDLIPAISEPDIGNQDFLSQLNQQMQIKNLGRPTWHEDPVTKKTSEGFHQPMWQASCTIKGFGKFPRLNQGFNHGEKQPCFHNKKRARQFAAKHALAAVSGTSAFSSYAESSVGRPSPPPSSRASSRGAPSGRTSPITEAPAMKAPPSSPTSKRIKVEDVDQSHVLSDESPDPSSSPSSRSEKDRANEQRIIWLTGRLNLEPPQYSIDMDKKDGTFRGTLRLKPGYKGLTFPPVEKMPNKPTAKKKLNEQFLIWLDKEYKDRMDAYEFLTKDMLP